MALVTSVAMEVGEKIHLELTLPGTGNRVRMTSEVCWNDNTGHVGVEFVEVPQAVLERLQVWLANRLEELLPEEVC